MLSETPNDVPSLPLYEEHSCALGVVIMNYLDELNAKDEPTAETTREQQKHLAQGWVANGDFLSSLKDALQLWDAVGCPLACPVGFASTG